MVKTKKSKKDKVKGKFIMPNFIQVPNVIRNNWSKFINAIFMLTTLTTAMLWVKNRNTEQHVNNLSLQLTRQPLDGLYFTPNYQMYQPKVQVNETNLMFDLYNTCKTSVLKIFTPIANYATSNIPYLSSILNRTISNSTATNNTDETISEENSQYSQPEQLCSYENINNEDRLHSCMAIANTSNQRDAILHGFHNNVGINNLTPEAQRAFATHIAETNSPQLTRSLTDQGAKDIARDQICKFACKAAAKAFGL